MKVCFFLVTIFLCFGRLTAQDEQPVEFKQTEALGQLKGKSQKEQEKVFNELVKNFIRLDPVKAIKALDFTIKYTQEKSFRDVFVAEMYLRRGQTYRKLRKFSMAVNDLMKAEDLYIKARNTEGLTEVCLSFANLYSVVNDNVKALKFALRAEKYAISIKSTETLGNIYNSLANLYKAQGKVHVALSYYQKSIAILRKKKNYNAEALLLDNISMAWEELKDSSMSAIDSAQAYNKQALKIAYENKDAFLELQLMPNSGGIAELKKEYEVQKRYALRGMHLADSLHIEAFFIYGKLNYGAALNNLKQWKEAIAIMKTCVEPLKSLQDYYALPTAYFELSTAYERLGRNDSALFYQKLNSQANDTLDELKSKDKVNEILAKIEIDQREEKISGLKKLNKVLSERNTLQVEKDRLKSAMLYGAIALLLVIAVLLVITFKRFKDNKKLSAEISLKNKALVTKNNEITDSINYAKRIQEALLPAANELSNAFSDSFILYKPKDIVSGDFYWVHKEKDVLYFAVGDCTGHGVPGGFMSMLGHSFLNEVVNERGVREPAAVLNQLRDKVISSLRQKGASGENKDGMDITFVVIDRLKNKLHYAAANNSFYIIRGVGTTEYKADKQPIGYYSNTLKPFTQHSIDLAKGDCVYLFTDGYPDQFGGNKGKKFKYSSLQKLLEQNAGLPMNKQQEVLIDTFETWRGRYEQTDDVCVAGIRI
jgi:serine phosphatase RsbU (regulator of sigma subunit)